MGNLIDLTGKKFEKLTVIKRADDHIQKNGRRRLRWECKCECGNIVIVSGDDIKKGHTKSCGCLLKTHGLTKTRLFSIMNHIKSRCYNKNHHAYNHYGGRGIKVCDEWLNDFKSFYEWSMANGYSDNLSIDRIDVNGNYEPGNCRWTNNKTQQNNTRFNKKLTYQGQTKNISQWAELLNIPYSTLYSRLTSGWEMEKIINTPIDKSKSTKK